MSKIIINNTSLNMKYISKEDIEEGKSLAKRNLLSHLSYIQPFWISEPYLVDSEEGKAINLLCAKITSFISKKELLDSEEQNMLKFGEAVIPEIYLYALIYKDTKRIWSSYGEQFMLSLTNGWCFSLNNVLDPKPYIHLVMET